MRSTTKALSLLSCKSRWNSYHHHGRELLHVIHKNQGCLAIIGSLRCASSTSIINHHSSPPPPPPVVQKNLTSLLLTTTNKTNHHHYKITKRPFSSPHSVRPPPPLFDYILQLQFDRVLQRTQTHPHEVNYTHPRGWTALHACAEYGAPIKVIKALIHIYPEAVHVEDWKGNKPVDVALLPEVRDFLEGGAVVEEEEEETAEEVNGNGKASSSSSSSTVTPPLDPNVYEEAVAKGLVQQQNNNNGHPPHPHALHMTSYKGDEEYKLLDTDLLKEVHDYVQDDSVVTNDDDDKPQHPTSSPLASLDPNVYDGISVNKHHNNHQNNHHDTHFMMMMMKQIDTLSLQVNELTNCCVKLSEEVNALRHNLVLQQHTTKDDDDDDDTK